MKSFPLPFWEIDLQAAIAEEVTAGGSADHRDPNVLARARKRLACRVNQDPINVAAKKWLPDDWSPNESMLHALTLMSWGIWEGGIQPASWPDPDSAAGFVLTMQDWNPAHVMALLANPERPDQSREEVILQASDLEASTSAYDAACVLLEQLDAIVVTVFSAREGSS